MAFGPKDLGVHYNGRQVARALVMPSPDADGAPAGFIFRATEIRKRWPEPTHPLHHRLGVVAGELSLSHLVRFKPLEDPSKAVVGFTASGHQADRPDTLYVAETCGAEVLQTEAGQEAFLYVVKMHGWIDQAA